MSITSKETHVAGDEKLLNIVAKYQMFELLAEPDRAGLWFYDLAAPLSKDFTIMVVHDVKIGCGAGRGTVVPSYWCVQ